MVKRVLANKEVQKMCEYLVEVQFGKQGYVVYSIEMDTPQEAVDFIRARLTQAGLDGDVVMVSMKQTEWQ